MSANQATDSTKPETAEHAELIRKLKETAAQQERCPYPIFGSVGLMRQAAALLAADGKAGGEVVVRYFDLTLTKDEAEYIDAFIADENEPDDEVVRLMTGPGHSGYGLYAFHPDYLDEGAVLVKSLPTPEPMKAADEFELRRLLAEEQYTVRQLNRALREATDAPTFMGEPVTRPQQATQVAPGLIEALRHQRQVDEDGTECGVNRQAVDEAITILESLSGHGIGKDQAS